jgi:hypothetical protein
VLCLTMGKRDDSGVDIPGVTPGMATMPEEIFTVLLVLHLESKVAYPVKLVR